MFNVIVAFTDRFISANNNDLARDKETTQSSTWSNCVAGQAVDGDLSTCTCTNTEINPFWSVDLGTSAYIQHLNVISYFQAGKILSTKFSLQTFSLKCLMWCIIWIIWIMIYSTIFMSAQKCIWWTWKEFFKFGRRHWYQDQSIEMKIYRELFRRRDTFKLTLKLICFKKVRESKRWVWIASCIRGIGVTHTLITRFMVPTWVLPGVTGPR